MTDITKQIEQKLMPTEWHHFPDAPCMLYATALITTSNTYSAKVKIMDSQNKVIGKLELQPSSGTTSILLGQFEMPTPTPANPVYPITIESEITANTEFDNKAGAQQSSGYKSANLPVLPKMQTPICFEVSNYCNDADSNNDWNDCVLTYQLFSSLKNT